MLLLDANVCIDVLRGRPDVVARLAAHGPAGRFLCSIVAIALTHDLALVSDDRAAFARVPDLNVVSWRDA